MDWSAWRDEFPILARKTYLNSCSLGALARTVRSAVVAHLDAWDQHGASAWYGPWLEELEATREHFARTVRAGHDEVAILPNVSSALSVVASGLPLAERPEVAMTELDFPTVGHQFLARSGVRVRHAPSRDGVEVPSERLEALVGERTAAVATSHVFYASGAIQDVRAICGAARRAGAISIIDAYQATGQVPTDVRELGCDVLIAGGLKWLLGGTGIAYLYVSRSAQDRLSPQLAGWFGDANQFNFDVTSFTARRDARRYEMGTPPLPSVFAGRAGLELVLGIGVDAIRRRQTELVSDLWDRFSDAGYALRTPDDAARRAGILMVELDDPPGVVRKLAEQDIIVDARPGRLRLSPYFYNTHEECERVFDAVASVTAGGPR